MVWCSLGLAFGGWERAVESRSRTLSGGSVGAETGTAGVRGCTGGGSGGEHEHEREQFKSSF